MVGDAGAIPLSVSLFLTMAHHTSGCSDTNTCSVRSVFVCRDNWLLSTGLAVPSQLVRSPPLAEMGGGQPELATPGLNVVIRQALVQSDGNTVAAAFACAGKGDRLVHSLARWTCTSEWYRLAAARN